MGVLVHERFEPGWQTGWTGKPHNAYSSDSRTEGEQGLRILFRQGNHYGTDLRRDITSTRRIKLSYWLRVASNWNSNTTGKLVGFADLRWANLVGQTVAHGNRPPRPNGFSFRTWFGKTKNGRVPIGIYVYHAAQKRMWGDTIPVGNIQVGAPHIPVEVEADLDAGHIRMRLDGNNWVQHPITVGPDTAVTTAWLNGYWGGWRKAPANMAADIDWYRLDGLDAAPATGTLATELHNLADRVAVLEAA